MMLYNITMSELLTFVMGLYTIPAMAFPFSSARPMHTLHCSPSPVLN